MPTTPPLRDRLVQGRWAEIKRRVVAQAEQDRFDRPLRRDVRLFGGAIAGARVADWSDHLRRAADAVVPAGWRWEVVDEVGGGAELVFLGYDGAELDAPPIAAAAAHQVEFPRRRHG